MIFDMSATLTSLSLLHCLFCHLFAACACACREYIFCLLFADCCQTLRLACSFLSFLFVAFSLPLGKPPFGVALEAFNHFLDIFGKADAFLLLYSFLRNVLHLFHLVLIFLFLDRYMDILLDELKISDVS